MSIKRKYEKVKRLNKVDLLTKNYATMYATLEDGAFTVQLWEDGDETISFDAQACEEAAEFFTVLRDELRGYSE